MKFPYQKIPFEGHDTRTPLIPRPILPVYLHGQKSSTPSPYYALLDSGADKVLMPAELAETVGVKDVKTGRLEPIVGVANQPVLPESIRRAFVGSVSHLRRISGTLIRNKVGEIV